MRARACWSVSHDHLVVSAPHPAAVRVGGRRLPCRPRRRRSLARARAARRHPLVVTLDKKSAPRTLFSGDRLVEVDLPAGTRVIYPRPPLEALKDVDAAIRYAINHPLGTEPLHAKLRRG